MRVHRCYDFCYGRQVSVDELAKTDVIFHGTVPGTPCHEEFEAGDAEGVLAID
jgi:hypothetical protein